MVLRKKKSLQTKRYIPKEEVGKNQKIIYIFFALSLLFFVLTNIFPSKEGNAIHQEMVEASRIMFEAMDVLKKCQNEKGLILDKESDLNQTGLIGLEFSPITTSIGSLDAKRTTTNPNFAALCVFLLKEAGVKKGDTIAIGASGSFPSLIVAVLAAAKIMNLKPLVICSFGASQWGANNPDFFWLHMHNCLLEAGVFDVRMIAISVGGDRDTGEDMSAEGRSFLIKEIQESKILFLHEPNLMRNVKAKISLLKEKAEEAEIRAFINIGGSWANMGEDSEVLKLKPGLTEIKQFPPIEKRGILYEMAARKIPVIHLLYIKGLVQRYGLVWDPVPLPHPGKGRIYQLAREKQCSFLILVVIYFLLVVLVLIFRNRLITAH